jgi:hypothetical protein
LEVGFQWSDELDKSVVVERVTVAFQTAYDCAGGTKTASLNGNEPVAYKTSKACDCTPTDSPTHVAFPGSSYNVGDEIDNVFVTKSSSDCLGFASLKSGVAVGSWAEVCVFEPGS